MSASLLALGPRARADGLALGESLLLAERLDLTDVEALLDDVTRRRFRIGMIDQRAGMTGRELAGIDVSLHRFRQLQQPQRVGDVAAAFADHLGDVVLRVIELVGKRLITGRLLQRIEIGALNVLDDGKLERLAIGDIEHDDRHFVQIGALRRAPAPLAGDDLEVIRGAGAHHDRLNNAALADRGGQFGELGVGEQLAWIARIGAHVFDRHLALAARHALVRLRLGANVADQRSETATQSRTCCVVGHGGVLRTHPAALNSPRAILFRAG